MSGRGTGRKEFHACRQEIVKDDNKIKYGGKMKCENCGKRVTEPTKSTSGRKPKASEAQVDHIMPKCPFGGAPWGASAEVTVQG